jgi:light-regulated signal transduction histidine kinase (bacteriophytochrome)
MNLDFDKLDFDHCEDEPIHIPESIQGYGYLFALEEETGAIKIYSENVDHLFRDYKNLEGSNFFDLLEGEDDIAFLKNTYNRAKQRGTRLPGQILLKTEYTVAGTANDFYVIVYESNGLFVIELEPAGEFRDTYSARQYMKLYATSVAPKFKAYTSLSSMAEEIVETIKYITGFERVVLFKFNENNDGQVIAEAKEDDMESYLGLLYPAGDIPPQARALYKKNWVRLTPNVDLPTTRLIPDTRQGNRKPLDLTNSILRSLSPIHLQYVRNQGLKASMSMSLVTHDHLWGMISCHSREPNYIPQNVRLECENLSQLFSWHLYAKEEELYIKRKDVTDKAINEMLDKTSVLTPIVEVFKNNEQEVLNITATDGFMYYTEEETITLGTLPDQSVINKLYKKAAKQGRKPYISSNISDEVKDQSLLNGICGALLIPLSENKSYFTAWFRSECEQIERWAGLPQEKNMAASKKERLQPRSSFAVQERVIKNASRPWDTNDIEMAHRFNKVFMTHALETQDQMRKNISKLELQSQYKNEFLATLAHELRNPLTPLTIGVSMLEETTNGEQIEVVDTMKRQINHMSTLINDLMDVSRITQGKVKLDVKTLAVRDIINNAVETCQRLIDEGNHQLSINLPGQPLYTDGDVTRLTQVFVNIINNAAKYTEAGGKITISVLPHEDWVSVKIKDNGIGIPPENLETIFAMFTQMDAYSTHTKGGLGIGLTLVKRLVDLHNGEIYARSEGLGKGTEFEVLLPLSDKEVTPTRVKESLPKSSSEKKKILIVDDNPSVLSMYNLLLKHEGYETRTAKTGREAIEIFKDFAPDFALFDIGMPDMDGFELCRRLSITEEGKNTIFISQSGWGNKEKVDEAKAAGFSEHLIKPLDRDMLRATLQKFQS